MVSNKKDGTKQNNNIDYHNVDSNNFRIGNGGSDHVSFNIGMNPGQGVKNVKNGTGQSGFEEHKK